MIYMNKRMKLVFGIAGLSLALAGCKQLTKAPDISTEAVGGGEENTNALQEQNGATSDDSGSDDATNDRNDNTAAQGSTGSGQDSSGQGAGTPSQQTVKTYIVAARNFSYSIDEIRVKKDDIVKIDFRSVDGFHDWVVDEFDARTARVDTGGTASIQFKADKVGIFEFYCSVGNHRQMGMVGRLIVE